MNKDRKDYEKKLKKYLKTRPKKNIIELFLQVQWERDIAIEQLHELGYELGEKIKKDDKAEKSPIRPRKALAPAAKMTKEVNIYNQTPRKIICVSNVHFNPKTDEFPVHELLVTGTKYTFVRGAVTDLGARVYIKECPNKEGFSASMFDEIEAYDKEILRQCKIQAKIDDKPDDDMPVEGNQVDDQNDSDNSLFKSPLTDEIAHTLSAIAANKKCKVRKQQQECPDVEGFAGINEFEFSQSTTLKENTKPKEASMPEDSNTGSNADGWLFE